MLDRHAFQGSKEFYIILFNDIRFLLDYNLRFGTLALRGVCGWDWSFCLWFRLQLEVNMLFNSI